MVVRIINQSKKDRKRPVGAQTNGWTDGQTSSRSAMAAGRQTERGDWLPTAKQATE